MIEKVIPGSVFQNLETIHIDGCNSYYNGLDTDIERFEKFYKTLELSVTEIGRADMDQRYSGDNRDARWVPTNSNGLEKSYISKLDIAKLLLYELCTMGKGTVSSSAYTYNILVALIKSPTTEQKTIREALISYIYTNDFIEVLIPKKDIPFFKCTEAIIQFNLGYDKISVENMTYQDPDTLETITLDVKDVKKRMALDVKVDDHLGNALKYLIYDFDIFLDNEFNNNVFKDGNNNLSAQEMIRASKEDDLYELQSYIATVEDNRTKSQLDKEKIEKLNQAAKEELWVSDMIKNGDIENVINYLYSEKAIGLNYDLTPNTYYSGNDAYVFINGTKVGEVTYIDWTLSEVTKPIFGYASYTWDTIAKGQRYVTGEISINFIKSNYLNAVLQKSLEDISKDEANVSVYDQMAIMDINQRKEYVRQILENSNQKDILNLAEKMDRMLWGVSNDGEYIDKSQQPYFNNPNQSGESTPFNVIIAWGNELFRIADMDSNGSETVTIINEVYLIEESSVVKISGENVQVRYKYIAKDLNNTLLTQGEKLELYSKATI